MSATRFESYLQNYLSAYWLRPVTALVRSLEAELLQLSEAPIEGSVELACGDGVNSFIARGGKLPEEFDVFQSVPLPSAESFFSGKLDVYDTRQEVLPTAIPNDRIYWQTGLDHKQNLLDKAALIHCYKNLVCQDLNQGLPLESESASFVFSNSIYWVKNVDALLRDIHRVMRKDGIAKFVIISPSFYENMAWSKLQNFGFRSLIDMGRHAHYQQLLSQSEWEKKFKAAGFKVNQVTPTFNRSLVHMIEFHDYREISPITAFMAKSLNANDHRKAKKSWISYMEHVFTSMHREGFFKATHDDSNYFIYQLEK
jgi:SAM-dependent methyltransferase